MCLKDKIARMHYRQDGKVSPWLWLMLPLEWGYRLGVMARIAAYERGLPTRFTSDVPVISVGNLTTGGTGKTPIVMELARGLIKAGKTVVVLSRGYGAKTPVDYARAMDPRFGDEAYLIQEQVPEAIVIVGKDRVQTLQRALADYRPDYVILDDGFQYLRLQRTVNILLFDGERLIGNGHLLPVGPLREPLSQIKRASILFITKTVSTESLQLVEHWVKQYGARLPEAPIQVVPVSFQPAGLQAMNKKHTDRPELFANRPVIAVSGVAIPEQFEHDLQSQNLTLLKHFRFSDHHNYSHSDFEEILALFRKHQAERPLLLTTDKDLPKLRGFIPAELEEDVFTLKMAPALDGQWFYYEFLSQMPGLVRAEDGHVRTGPGR